jgi:hypothetical protein
MRGIVTPAKLLIDVAGQSAGVFLTPASTLVALHHLISMPKLNTVALGVHQAQGAR